MRSVHWSLLHPLSTDRNCCLESKSSCFSFLHVLSLEYPVLILWMDGEKDTWTWQFPRFQVFQALHSKESWCVGMDRAIVAGPMDSCSSPEYRGHSGGPVDISILGRGGWNLEAEEHLALLPSTCTFLGVLWLPGSVLNGYKSVVTLRVNH